MTFTVNEFRDLLQIIRTMPEWKEELRRELLGEEILGLPKLVQRIADELADMKRQFTEQMAETNRRLGNLEQNLGVLQADVKVLKDDSKVLKDDVKGLKDDVGELKHDVKGLKQDVGDLKGERLERKYRERPFVYFKDILRKLRTLSDPQIADLLTDALDTGVLTQKEVNEISLLDVIVQGRRVSDNQQVYLAVEVSAKIDAHDVSRVRTRANLLSKLPGIQTIAAVAGEELLTEGEQAAKLANVWCVTDGHAVSVTAP